ncbi:MAG TPA: ORF6N domain-containing protein [Arachidicoccus sp.]
MRIIQSIQNRTYGIRGERVMLDYDQAAIYEVRTKVLNQAIKRNIQRFPAGFMFRLTAEECLPMRSQIVTASQRKRNTGVTPCAFTEQGVAMLSSVLTIHMNIAIMRAFVEIRRILLLQTDIKEQLRLIQERINEHDMQLSQIHDSIENPLDENAAKRHWDERERIGFKK